MPEISNDTQDYNSETFESQKLSGQKLNDLEFDRCEFRGCDFSQVKFDKCSFIDCKFVDCNLSVAKIGGCKFTDVIFHQCKLLGIDWTVAHWPLLSLSTPIAFTGCVMDNASFFGLKLEKITLKDCRAREVDLREGIFTGANFCGTDFAGSLFNQTTLELADFNGAKNFSINIFLNKLKGAKFNRYEAVGLLEHIGVELVD